MRSARALRRLRNVIHFLVRAMLAPIKPESLLVKFLFAAPCVMAMLTVTCQREPEPDSSPRPQPDVDPQAAPTPNAG
jgi:hypothetical protein